MKAILIRTLVVRQRVASGVFSFPEDAEGLKSIAAPFKILLFTSSPVLTSQDDHVRLQATDHHNMDNEPLLLIAALSWGFLTNGNPAPYAVQLLYSLVAARFIHNVSLLTKSQPLRFLAFAPPFFGTLFIGVQALIAATTTDTK